MTCDMDCIYRDATGVCTISPQTDRSAALHCNVGVPRAWIRQNGGAEAESYAPNGMGREEEE